MNRVQLIGNIGMDPELKFTQGGQAYARIRIAVSERYKARDGEWKEKSTWLTVVVWGKPAEWTTPRLHKGSRVLIDGKLVVREWTDKAAQKRFDTEVHVSGFDHRIEVIERPQRGESGDRAQSGGSPKWREPAALTDDGASPIDDFIADDIPF